MNQTRGAKKIIKKRKTKKYVSFVLNKSVKVMQGTVFVFGMINVISEQMFIVSYILQNEKSQKSY